MRKKDKLVFLVLGMIFTWILGMIIWSYTPIVKENIRVEVDLEVDVADEVRMYYVTDGSGKIEDFSEENFCVGTIDVADKEQTLSFELPYNTTYVRLDMSESRTNTIIYAIRLGYEEKSINYEMQDAMNVTVYNNVSAYFLNDNNCIEMVTEGENPYIVWNIQGYDLQSIMLEKYIPQLTIFKIVMSFVLVILLLIAWKKRNLWGGIPKDLYADRKMIWSLAKTDFKSRYASSYFGVVWAFVQPVVTISIYVFVFQVGFKAGDTSTGYPFLLYLISGIIPWFFFAEAWMSATNCLIEYNYLVKKVVFKISVLPIVKVISSLFVHVAFVVLALVVFTFSGRMPGIQVVQIIYYLICVFALALALAYLTSAIIPFFTDLAQIINIFTQLGMWTLPIMYDEAIIGGGIMKILRLNPMYYVVTGYRNALMNGQWFWERTGETVYFWVIVLVLFTIGFRTFKKLRVHFADVL